MSSAEKKKAYLEKLIEDQEKDAEKSVDPAFISVSIQPFLIFKLHQKIKGVLESEKAM